MKHLMLAAVMAGIALAAPVYAQNYYTSVQPLGTVKTYDVKSYGAAGDGTTDDRLAIQAAIDAANGAGIVYLPPGTYIVSPVADDSKCLDVMAGTKIQGAGMGLSTLKVINSAGTYTSVITASSNNCGGCEFTDFTIDSNVANNALANAAESSSYPRNEFRFFGGDRITWRRVRLTNSTSRQGFYANAAGIDSISITDCIVDNFGDDPNNIDHDASVVYTTAERVVISGNIFTAVSRHSPAGTTAIETHGGLHVVTGNVIRDFEAGINITGVDASGDSQGVTVANNSILGAVLGIQIWSRTQGAHTTGYGVDGLAVTGNTLIMNQASYSDVSSTRAIYLETGTTLPSKNIIIANNVVRFDLEVADITRGAQSMGIGYWNSSGSEQVENFLITGNVVENSPMACLYVNAPATGMTISNNVFVNCASTLDTDIVSGQRNAVFLILQPGKSVEIRDNQIMDTIDTTRTAYGFYVSAAAGTTDVLFRNNQCTITGGTQTAWVRSYNFTSDTDLNGTVLIDRISGFADPAGAILFGPGSVVHSDNGSVWMAADSEFNTGYSTVASASAITIANTGPLVGVTGVTGIVTINDCDAGAAGRVVTLIFAGSLTVTDGSNLKLAGDFVATADDTLTICCDGSNWYEVSRSAN